MRIAVTGATGFIGNYLVKALTEKGHDLRLLHREGRESALPQTTGGSVELHAGDLTKPETIEGFLENQERLIHLAAAHDHVEDELMRSITVGGTEALLADATRFGHNKDEAFEIWIVSSAVIGAPVYSYYRDTKRIQEKLIRGSGINWTSFRPTLVYGVNDMRHTAPLLRKCAGQSGKFVIPHDGKSRISPVHVDDVVEAIMLYFDYEIGIDCCYELAGPQGMSYNQFVDDTIAAAGGTLTRKNVSKKWADRAIFLKGLFTDTTADRRASAYFTLDHEHDITNAVDELGWSPRPYAEGIKQVAQGDWWKE
ncbi:MAG: nucleoside-diphosphate-sugar epimerase [Candidatus Paceibacteria bacterium]|jgi:nucleoside-diphosphate-sugar epimerase